MPAQEHAPIGAPCWIDLLTSDKEASVAFYRELFGWNAEPPDEQFGGYFMFTKDGVPVAGAMTGDPAAPVADAWSVYLTTDDARKTTEAAAAGGGQVQLPAMDVGDIGTMAVVADPGGARIGIWEPRSFYGFSVQGEPGTPAWFELFTKDYQSVLAFYRDAFGWNTRVESDTPEFRYATLVADDLPRAGVMDAAAVLGEGDTATWSVYFQVSDADDALSQVFDLGGRVLQPAQDTPYGRMGEVADPNGAPFKVVTGTTTG
jgi:uncharacterized protein